jgi:hypothetical protein
MSPCPPNSLFPGQYIGAIRLRVVARGAKLITEKLLDKVDLRSGKALLVPTNSLRGNGSAQQLVIPPLGGVLLN